MNNTRINLLARPIGNPTPECWDIEEVDTPELQENQVLVQVQYLSIDPAMRGWMNEGKSYVRPVRIGEVMRALGAGVVVESKHPDFKAGDSVTGITGVQEYAVLEGKDLGLTAYFGLLDTGQPKLGETVLVSGAAGAVGSVVGQIAKIKGCRAVGIAGGEDKCKYVVEELGFDACVDYKTGNPDNAIKKLKNPLLDPPHGGDYWRQAVFYKLLIDNHEQGKYQVMSTEFDFIEPNAKKEIKSQKLEITREDTDQLRAQVVEVWEKIQSREFYKGCGEDDCHWCNFVKTNKLEIQEEEEEDLN